MEKGEKEGKKFYLPWPWTLVVCILLGLVLRVFSMPVIVLLLAWNWKQRPRREVQGGYCLQRTRRGLKKLLTAVVFLLGAVGGSAYIVAVVGEDKSRWGAMEYMMLLFCGVFAVVCLVYSVKLGYTSLRDALFPAKSALAQSIRSQLPYPEEAPEVEALFDMVDQDIGAHGKWFDRVAVGEQWVFGDMVTATPRIRAVFGRDEVLRGSGMQRARIVQLYILDDRHQVQWTDLRNPRALQELLEYLVLEGSRRTLFAVQRIPPLSEDERGAVAGGASGLFCALGALRRLSEKGLDKSADGSYAVGQWE